MKQKRRLVQKSKAAFSDVRKQIGALFLSAFLQYNNDGVTIIKKAVMMENTLLKQYGSKYA